MQKKIDFFFVFVKINLLLIYIADPQYKDLDFDFNKFSNLIIFFLNLKFFIKIYNKFIFSYILVPAADFR